MTSQIKVVLLGDSSVGKTSIILKYTQDKFDPNQETSIGNGYGNKPINIEGTEYILNIWDTAGTEKYNSVSKLCLEECQILLLCFSITDHKSFENLENWKNLASSVLNTKSLVLGIVGNKSDLYENEQVKDEEANTYAEKNDAIYKLVSAKEGIGINQLFEDITKKYIDSGFSKIFYMNRLSISSNIIPKDNNRKKSCCK